MGRFVALGDSLTEGVGDPHPRCPNGFRGWADIVAARLAAQDPTTDYANLALRAKRTVDVAAEQVGHAVRMRPDAVTVWAGGNDLLRPAFRHDDVLAPLDEAVCRLAASGAHVVLVSGWAPLGSMVLRPMRSRVVTFDQGIRAVAARHGATLLDLPSLADWSRASLWCADRVHPSPAGHVRIADAVGLLLGVRPPRQRRREDAGPPGSAARDAGSGRRWRDERAWWFDHAAPHMRRWVMRTSSREPVSPKWPEPVPPASAFGWREEPAMVPGSAGVA